MKILVLNCGSSSLKYQVIDMDTEEALASGLCERIGMDGSVLTHKPEGKDKFIVETPMKDHEVAIKLVMDILVDKEHGVLENINEVGAVGHRVVHGGKIYTDSVVVDDKVKEGIKACFDLGPLHNPANLMGIEACERAMPGVKNVAVFDTAFGGGMEEEAYLYAIPYGYYEKYGIRKYGFHGTSHKYVSGLVREKEGVSKVIVCHLGNGASVSASIDGKCIDTSMGLTPLDGLVMGTRSGTIDPAVIQFISKHENKSIDEIMDILNKKSGFLGLSEISSDCRDIEDGVAKGNENAIRAYKAFVFRVVHYIGAYAAEMNGVDAICFTAGIGENGINMRRDICEYLGYLGIKIDDEKNNVRGKYRELSTSESKVKVLLVPTNEELAIAKETVELI